MKCAAITAGGGKCKRNADHPSNYCYSHDPERAAERKKYAAQGGVMKHKRATISAELTRLQGVFEKLAEDVLEGRQERGAAAVAIQALNGARGCVIGALKAREQEELARELEELKSYVQDRGVSRWRA
jgi:hypothetical protein